MANQENIMDNVVNAQKQVVDNIVENTKKFTNGNTMISEAMQKSSEWYKNWLESQKNIFTQTTEQAETTTEKAKENVSKLNEFYQNWYNNQVNAAKQVWDTNLNWIKSNTTNTTADNSNPMNQMMNNWNNWMNNFSQGAGFANVMNQWQNNFQKMNPFNNQTTANPFSMDSWKQAGENATNMFNQYYEMLTNTFTDLQKNLKNGTTHEAFHNMVNVSEGFSRFYEMWAPMWKSIQDKTFNMDMYKQYANPEMYKEVMDKYFGFLPENVRHYMHNMSDMMTNGMKNSGGLGLNSYNQMRSMMGNMPGMNPSEMFGGVMNAYNTFNGMMNNSFAPIAKMITPNQYTKTMMEWNDISNRIMVYNIKNAELQYMIYNQGAKVMDSLAENIANKIQNGEEVNSIMSLYQEWLNLGDKVYVSLFESDEYSALMAEVSAMQLKLRKDIEGQTEKLMVGIPVATRSEMDELYKTIYELKKQVRELQRSMEATNENAAVAESNEVVNNVEEPTTEATAPRRAKKA